MRKISSITCIIFGCGMFAFSDVIVSLVTNMPTENVLISNATGSGGLGWRQGKNDGTEQRDIGQSFLASTDAEMISFSLAAAGGLNAALYNAAFTVTIYSNSTSDVLGSVVSTQTGDYFSSGSGIAGGVWMTFALDDSVKLSSGNYYTFVLSWDDLSATDSAYSQSFLHSGSGNVFTDGRLWQNNAGVWSGANGDLVFAVQAIPEPVSAGLLTIGGVALMFFRKRFKK